VEYVEEMRNAYKILAINNEVNRLLRRPRHRCKNNNKTYLNEIGCENVDWIHASQDVVQYWALCDHDNETTGYIRGGGSSLSS
jgi:hypothetical protein